MFLSYRVGLSLDGMSVGVLKPKGFRDLGVTFMSIFLLELVMLRADCVNFQRITVQLIMYVQMQYL